MLHVLLVAAAGLATFFAIRHVMAGLQAAKARVRTRSAEQGRVTRLRQDPQTGVYYPED